MHSARKPSHSLNFPKPVTSSSSSRMNEAAIINSLINKMCIWFSAVSGVLIAFLFQLYSDACFPEIATNAELSDKFNPK